MGGVEVVGGKGGWEDEGRKDGRTGAIYINVSNVTTHAIGKVQCSTMQCNAIIQM